MNPTAATESRRTPERPDSGDGERTDAPGDVRGEAPGAAPADGGIEAALERLPSRLRQAVEPHADRLDIGMIADAYAFAEEAHSGQKRASGESFIVHTTEVARILAELHLDTVSIVAGLIHDTVEDTSRTLDDVETQFGEEVARVVDGVTKIGKVQFRSATEQQVENYRKLLLSMASDARVILIKLVDRLHNMRTL
ncbi:MAG: HD domain-containing protein, partial [Gemmatimonadetes bacterium]|nr:bifunctional (p)ppGpp synthetase/guanosine-3',5'-bis(diphosphate) 3'-pyrophosphohydrolase [Gemmatimonadota bacterium]NIU80591.1 HD domain-containing protein [Gammaproteobacteria bacterium]NIP83983.1 bifunctional (p)ppGpp synthetase/guanosine-3',5'-bis(diphosphate) 3'-pyrophosphohydrolase [Gemmatimonadota bacterium]NIQ60374.1 bifunctional (p)ppGpp synthetase/guanosine-3',5'-bis(diphosphate) 3'-pyrophosphohydrolase [Gemmatimonadota bacterium]NIX48894.1 HD domain-containing protein [Gemmatimona